jgi:hypothetical protein
MMKNILIAAANLSDHDLLARLAALAGKEREATVELVAHLAALDSRPSVHAAQGYGSLFSYCTQALRLSEDAACNRIEAARACRRFPVILDHLASGSLTLTSVRLLGRHLTPENHAVVLEKARGRRLREIEVLVAELAPRPDTPSSVRKVPASPGSAPTTPIASGPAPGPDVPASAAPPVGTSRPIVQPTAPERYRVQFTIGQATHEKLRRLQTLLRREVPDGDPALIFDRAITLLLERVESRKLGATIKPRRRPIRPATDREIRTPIRASRNVPQAVKDEVCRRDAGQCAFISSGGQRCSEREFLEFHHLQPYARNGPPTTGNIALRCRRHNQYEAEIVFGPGARLPRPTTQEVFS